MSHAQKKTRLGIIGCGRVAEERHLPALRRLPGVCVVAVADVNRSRMDHLGERLGVARRFADYRALLDLAEVEAVAVLTPTQSHAEIGLAALDAGKHILVEKPLALNLADCDRLRSRAAASGCKVVVCFNLRWHRLVRRARAFVQAGALGRIKAVRSVYTHNRSCHDAPDWHRKLDLGGGVCFNEGVHHFDLWRHLLGKEVEQIFSLSVPFDRFEDETNAVTGRLTDGAVATAIFSFRTGPTSEVEIYGESGRLQISLYRYDGLAFFSHAKYPGDVADRLVKSLASVRSLAEAIPLMRRGGDFGVTFDGVWKHFLDCIHHDKPSECTLEDGRRALEVALAAVRSARTGLPVQIGAMDSSRRS